MADEVAWRAAMRERRAGARVDARSRANVRSVSADSIEEALGNRGSGGVLRCGAEGRPMRIYTKTGDDGTTGLFGNQRVPKDALRVEVYGTVDETNTILGLALAAGAPEELARVLLGLQSRLFDLG